MTVEDLVLRYESDVLIRIETLDEEKAQLASQLHNGGDVEFYKDWDDQIAHWKVTLADIQVVIEKEKLR